MSWWLTDGEDLNVQINSEKELEAKLKELNAEEASPILALENSAGHFMYIGLAGDKGFLNYYPDADGPENYVSVNDAVSDGSESIWFSYAGSGSEILVRNCLPMDRIRQTVPEYFNSESLPTSIKWQKEGL